MKTRQIRDDFGLEISDIDLSQPLSNTQFQQMLEYFYQYSVLLFPNQLLTPQAQAEFCHRLGQPKIETRKQFNFQECPEVSTIGNIIGENDKQLSFFARGGFGWHTDGTAACHVNAATLLYAVEVPRDGGDTLFVSTASTYERAPNRLKQQLESVSVLSSFHAHNDPLLKSDPASFIPLSQQERDALPPVWHKVIQVHPVTKRKVFYLNLDPLEFEGIDDQTGRELLQQIVELASLPEYIYQHCWTPGELIIWDNHSMLHSGTPTVMYESDRRLMHRSFVYTLPTERPLPNYEELSQIFTPTKDSIQLSDFDISK
ncbi:MAG: taurine dioxygenase [Gammaproteobacteria bacterium]|jgi:taurine dioxygenase